jgi:SAM-dependent methyltransferase
MVRHPMRTDDIAGGNRRFWSDLVRKRCAYTLPWSDLDPDMVRSFAEGEIDTLPRPYLYIYPGWILEDVAGKDVLCLASGGGQQSAVFGILGAKVTVLDLTDEQLASDRRVAGIFGYDVRTLTGDMRDLSVFADSEFDMVYQAISMCFVPTVREVYREVARVLRPGGLYRVAHCDPATQTVEETSWDNEGYRILEPYNLGRISDTDSYEFRHSYSDMFNGLIDLGFAIRGVYEDPRHSCAQAGADGGSYDHMLGFVLKYFAIVAEFGDMPKGTES